MQSEDSLNVCILWAAKGCADNIIKWSGLQKGSVRILGQAANFVLFSFFPPFGNTLGPVVVKASGKNSGVLEF